MSGSMNRVILVGNVGRDPEIRATQLGTRIATFSVATSETWRDKASGERKESTDWHNIVVFNEPLAEIIEKYVRKGSKVLVEGKLKTRKWTDQSGQDRYTTEVVIQAYGGTLLLLGGGQSRGPGSEDDYTGGAAASPRPTRDALDDEIPF